MQSILENPTPAEGEMMPDEVLALEEQKKLQVLEKIEQFGLVMSKKREDAVNARRNSGIEQDWQEDLDSYEGIDEVNRVQGGWQKPNSPDGVLTSNPRNREIRSTVFLNITRPYVDAAAAKVADMLLPTDDRNWSIKPTPMPELSEFVKSALATPTPMSVPASTSPQGSASAPNPGMMPPNQGMPPQGMQPPVPQDPVAAQVQQAMKILDEANKRADKAQTQIEDWLIECQYHAEIRKVIEDAAKLGTGILKGPFPVKTKRRMFRTDSGMAQLEILEEIKPGCRRIDPQNFFPDGSCGEDIHNGNGVWERDYITARQLKELIGLPGYVTSQIKAVLEEGPAKRMTEHFSNKYDLGDKDKYEIWYWHGFAEKDDLEAIGVDVEQDAVPTIPALITMVNDRVIKGALNPLESGEYPYHLMPWQRRPGMPWGMGVARQCRTPQRMLNAATRAMMDNSGLASGPQIVVKRGALEPADGSWAITPRKIWYVKNESEATVRDAFQIYSIETRQAELMNIVQFAMKLAEDVTGLPMILQGQQGQAPDTVGGMQLLANNASSVLRRLARTFDDTITEPFIRAMYDWLMLYGEDDDMKGDYIIDARGSTALVERDIQNQEIAAMGQLVMNPAFGLSPDKWIKELLKSKRFDPKKFEMSDEEKQMLAQRQPPAAPQVQAAQIRAQVEMQKAQMDNQTEQMRIKRDTDRDTVFVQAETERTRNEFMSRREELMVRRELELLKYATQQKMTLEQVKADLASTAMKLRTQKELAVGQARIDLHKHNTPQVATPAVEVPGRAPNGEAFQR